MMTGLDGCIQGVRITSGSGDGDGESNHSHSQAQLPQHGGPKGRNRTTSAPTPPVGHPSLK